MQYFTGEVYFEHELPCGPSSLTHLHIRLDEARAEELLSRTIEAAKTLKAIRPRELRVISIDTAVQEKNVEHPTDSRGGGPVKARGADRRGRHQAPPKLCPHRPSAAPSGRALCPRPAVQEHAPGDQAPSGGGTEHRPLEGRPPHAPELAQRCPWRRHEPDPRGRLLQHPLLVAVVGGFSAPDAIRCPAIAG